MTHSERQLLMDPLYYVALRCLTLPNPIKFLIDPHNQLPYDAFIFNLAGQSLRWCYSVYWSWILECAPGYVLRASWRGGK